MDAEFFPWVEGLTIGRSLRETARRTPDHEAVVFPGLAPDGLSPRTAGAACYRRTWAEWDRDVDECARALLASGVAKGDHVAVWATNWPQWVLMQFATARIGAVMVTVNPAYRSSELAYVLNQSDATMLFLVDRFRTSDYFAIFRAALNEPPQGSRPNDAAASASASDNSARSRGPYAAFPKLREVVCVKDASAADIASWLAFMARAESVSALEVEEREATLAPHDPINIQYTSGTTGFPKGVMLTHRNILFNAWCIGDCQLLTPDDRVCIPVPFYHCFGCVLGTLCCAVSGSAMVIPAEHFDPLATLNAIEQERSTAVYGVPTMYIAQLEHPTFAGRDLSTLRTGIMAGSPCPIELMKRVVSDMHCPQITIAYGLTEASPVITQTRTEDPLDLRVQTVGRILPGVEVKLVDPSTGETVGDDRNGELCCRGHGVMLGYYNMPEATAATIDEEGWLHSGDLALRLSNGYYRITGRIKDMICRGGENIYPREIEEFLYTHPAIQDVAVVGVPDRKYVEEVCAWIRLRPNFALTEDELRGYCKGRMAHFKIPRYVRFVTEFPQTVTGKIQKFRIRERMIEELKLLAEETA
jgi:fatty-acyl-CoA synthase